MEVETYPADFISIHAPVKGATPRLGRGHRAGHDFNPRSREGSDLPSRPYSEGYRVFQSTLP